MRIGLLLSRQCKLQTGCRHEFGSNGFACPLRYLLNPANLLLAEVSSLTVLTHLAVTIAFTAATAGLCVCGLVVVVHSKCVNSVSGFVLLCAAFFAVAVYLEASSSL